MFVSWEELLRPNWEVGISCEKSHIPVVKAIDVQITWSQLSEALMSFIKQGVHVYSNSWGPGDNGNTTGGFASNPLIGIKYGIAIVSKLRNMRQWKCASKVKRQ
ncbi:hypothetical protein Ciccas_007856 [Cichlidogyrus casuarinus]|uniref:Uncharacterized protein n=1 Tax=Cichlidogyrus casuarinus TaxID=1844966 RepID=A0ABD2Q1W9_9PLAT